MSTHAMIDIETLGTTPEAVVLSVGAVKFDPNNSVEPHSRKLWRPSVDAQVEIGREVSEDTLKWWSKQDQAIQDVTFTEEGRVSVKDMMADLNRYLVGCDKIWCQGPQFDMVILENLFRQYEHHHNWAFWQIMDSRTLFQIMPTDPRKAIQENAHSADDDAYWQAVCVQRVFKHFGIMPR